MLAEEGNVDFSRFRCSVHDAEFEMADTVAFRHWLPRWGVTSPHVRTTTLCSIPACDSGKVYHTDTANYHL